MPDGPNAQGILNDREIEALETAHHLYGGQAKVEAAEMIGGLDVPTEVADEVIVAIAARIDNMGKFTDRREAAEHFVALSRLLGSRIGVQSLQVVPSPEAAVVAEAEPIAAAPAREAVVTVPEPDVETEPAIPAPVPKTRTARRRVQREERERSGSPQKNVFNKIFSNANPELFDSLSPEQLQGLVKDLCFIYENLQINRLSLEARQQRAQQLTDFFAGMSFDEIAARSGASRDAIWQGLNKIPESITKRVDSTVLDELLGQHLNGEQVDIARSPVVPIPSTPTAPPTPPPFRQKSENQQEQTGIPGAVDLVAEVLDFSSRDSYEAIKRVFDENATDSRKGREESIVRSELKNLIDLIQGSDIDDEIKLDGLEANIFDALVGRAPEYRSPLCLKSIKGKFSREFQREGVKIDTVVFNATKKLKYAKQTLRVQNAHST